MGNDANSGLTPSSPKASISAVLSAYVIKPGDTIYVDAGTYNLSTTLILNAVSSGVKIVGYSNPTYPSRATVIDRGNTSASVIELQNADNVTLDHLTIRGGYYGVYANSSSDSDNLTISNSVFVANSYSGVFFDQSNDTARILNNRFDPSGGYYGLQAYGADAVISTNFFTGGLYGSGEVSGARSLVSNNTFNVVRNGLAIYSSQYVPADRIIVRDNRYDAVSETAIPVSSNGLVTGNIITHAGTGISGTCEFRNNIVSDGTNGIYAYSGSTVTNNRIFNNTSLGLLLGGSTTNSGNRIYNNSVGIQMDFGSAGAITNNFVYDNYSVGIQINSGGYYGGTPTIANNTIIQKAGSAIYVYDGRSQNVLVKNNIIQISGGYALKVEPESSRGFISDYNVINVTGTGKIARWENSDFNSPADWYYEVGLDKHSKFTDPQFVNLAGPDERLGFDAGGGLSASFYNNTTFTGTPALTRIDTSINFYWSTNSPDPAINADNFSARWTGYLYVPTAGTYTFHEQSDDSMALYLDNVKVIDQPTYVGYAERTYTTTFASAGYHAIRLDMVETTGSAGIVLNWSGPGISKQAIGQNNLGLSPTFLPSDFGADDNFALAAGSPANDAGDLNAPYYKEPSPNGGRINAGALGNTLAAELSSQQSVQILSPNGLEKYKLGNTVKIDFQAANLKAIEPVVLINGGSNSLGKWVAGDAFLKNGSIQNYSSGSGIVDTSGLTNPAPASLYNSQFYGSETAGDHLLINMPVFDGSYTVRLHFSEPFYSTPNNRNFDIAINGNTKRLNYEISTAAGGINKAVVEEFSGIVASGGTGVTVDLTNRQGGYPRGPMVAAIELLRVNPIGVASPTVALDYSSDGGTTWTPIAGASGLPIDRYGSGTFNWTIPNDLPVGANYKIRARSTTTSNGEVSGVTYGTFLVANSGTQYFVSTFGDNRNSGKALDQPVKSLSGLIYSYDLDPGDVINMASGNYRLYRNTVITNEDSGVTIRGSATIPTILDRGNVNSAQRAFDLQNADSVTLDLLRITGGEIGIAAVDASDSDDLVIRNSQIYGNSYSALYIGSTNDRWNIGSNKVYGVPGGTSADDQNYGLFFNNASNGHRISGNEIYDNSQYGIYTNNPLIDTVISGNDVHGNRYGINAQFSVVTGAIPLTIRDNTIRDNSDWGLYANSNSSAAMIVTGNLIFGHIGVNDVGLYAWGGTQATNNTVYGNYKGIVTQSGSSTSYSVVSNNRVYNNSFAVITAESYSQVLGNYVYSNATGIIAMSGFAGSVSSNLVYANTNRGLLIQGANGGLFYNNTLYQTVGDGIRIDSSAQNLRLSNNIIWVLAGYGLYVDNNSQTGLSSDYNLFYRGTAGVAFVGTWNGVNRATISDWRTATSKDANSLEADPGFVDIDGADNTLGYDIVRLTDGGQDDNFYRTKNSPAVDRGSSWFSAQSDIEVFGRVDDPTTTDAGGVEYAASTLTSTIFGPSAVGVAKNWRADDGVWTLAIPFTFNFYGINYTSVNVSSNGLLQFNSTSPWPGDPANSTASLNSAIRIAPLWDDLRTDLTGDDIFVDTSIANQIMIHWSATVKATSAKANFAATLFSDGHIRFDYGTGNTGLTPTVGISRGDGRFFNLPSGYDGATSLTNATSLTFNLVPGIADIGAYEFRGNSSDNVPPTVLSVLPSAVITVTRPTDVRLTFSEELNPIDARSPAAYELRGAGPDSAFDTADDVTYKLKPQYTPGQNTVILGFEDTVASLPLGVYRVTAFGTVSTSLYDLAGNRFDGNADGQPGGNYNRIFRVIQNNAPVLSGLNLLSAIDEDILAAANGGSLVSSILAGKITDADGPFMGVAVTSVDSINGTWQYSLDGTTFQPLGSQLSGGKVLLLASDSDSRIRFLPIPDLSGIASGLVLRAWDRADQLPEGTAILPAQLFANSLSPALATASITVNPINDAPTDLFLSSTTVAENKPIGMTIGILTATDVDFGDTHLFTLVVGSGSTDNSQFAIVGNQLTTNAKFDFES